VNGHQFRVVGVMARMSASFPGQEDRRVLVPYFSMRKMFPNAKQIMFVIVSFRRRMSGCWWPGRSGRSLARRSPQSSGRSSGFRGRSGWRNGRRRS
jgi:hypothetical protein